MKFFSILFILCTLYYFINRDHLLNAPENRVYKSKFHVYLDLSYFILDGLYLLWLLVLAFIDFKFSLVLIAILVIRWISFDRFKPKLDYGINLVKIMALLSYFLIS